MVETAPATIRHPVDEVLPPGPMFVNRLQHVMSMYAGAVAVPLIVGGAIGLQFADLAYLLTAALLVSVAVGVGVIPIAVPDFYEEFPSWFETIFESGISAAAVTAVLLNLLFNTGRRQSEEGPIYAEGPAPGLTPEYQPGGHLPHEDAFTQTYPHVDVDQGQLPPCTVSPSNTTALSSDKETPPDKETPR
jgi:hypothetical protein